MASDLDEAALGRWIDGAIPSIGKLIRVQKFADGQSNPTYRLETDRGELVLRRKPFGHLLASAHSVDREFAVVGALHRAGFPVPKPIALCESDSIIGSMFYVMDFVDGRIFWDGRLDELPPTDRRRAYEAMIDTLARLHSISVESVGLQWFGREGNYFARQVDRWRRQYYASQTDNLRDVDDLITFLSGSIPRQERTTIIHGDYRIDNLVYHRSGFEVAAVLDWELSTLGDPMADLTYFAMNWIMPHIPGRSYVGGLDLRTLGIPELDQMIERYCMAVGLTTAPKLDWYLAFNLFRSIGILQGVKKRMLSGNASSASAAAAVEVIPQLISTASHFAALAAGSTASN